MLLRSAFREMNEEGWRKVMLVWFKDLSSVAINLSVSVGNALASQEEEVCCTVVFNCRSGFLVLAACADASF